MSQSVDKTDSIHRDAHLGLNNTWNTFLVKGNLIIDENAVIFQVLKDSALVKRKFYQFNHQINDLTLSTSDIIKVKRNFDFNPSAFTSVLVILTNDRIKYKFYRIKDKKEITLFLKKSIRQGH